MSRPNGQSAAASGKFSRQASSVYHAITVVWGAAYLDLFLNTCIPNQLGEGNVTALPAGSRYRILTRAAHVDEVRSHAMVQALERLVHVDVVGVDALDALDSPDAGRRGDPRYELMTACHRLAIADAMREGAALMFLSPDILVSAGTFAAVVRRHREGSRAVVCTGLRLEKEPVLEAVGALGRTAGALPPRDLVRVALPHLHQFTRTLLHDAPAFSTFPVAVYWRVGSDGLLARCFHLHPLMIDPMSTRAIPKGTIDGDYLVRAVPDAARVHVVTDSDELVVFELTDARRTVLPHGKPATAAERQALVDAGAMRSTGRGASVWRAAAVAARGDELQVGYWRSYPIRLHARDIDASWVAAEAAADAFVRAVVRRVRPFGIRSPGWFKRLERARQIYERYRRAWRRRMPRIRMKQVLRPLRLAKSRVGRALRKTGRQVRGQGRVHTR